MAQSRQQGGGRDEEIIPTISAPSKTASPPFSGSLKRKTAGFCSSYLNQKERVGKQPEKTPPPVCGAKGGFATTATKSSLKNRHK